MAKHLTTATLAKHLSVSPATVRRWADAGLLPAERTAGGHRRFSVAVAERLARQHAAHQRGTAHWVKLLVTSGPALAIDAALLEERSRVNGWYEVAEKIGRVLVELGVQWHLGVLSVIDEHIASERIARALSRVSDTLPRPETAARAFLATALGDEHTLGLSLVELVMREAGWDPVWLGRGVPTEQLAVRTLRERPAAVILSASNHSEADALRRSVMALADACGKSGAALVVGGRGPWPERLPGFKVIRTFDGLRDWMAAEQAARANKARLMGAAAKRPQG